MSDGQAAAASAEAECWGCVTGYSTSPNGLCHSCATALALRAPIPGRPILNATIAAMSITADDERDRCWRCDVRRGDLVLGLCTRCHDDLTAAR